MIKRRRSVAALQPRREDGTLGVPLPLPEPSPPLLEAMRFLCRAAVRKVYNCPKVTRHVERMALTWLMDWDPIGDPPIRSYMVLRASNEARRLKAMTPRGRTLACSRSSDRGNNGRLRLERCVPVRTVRTGKYRP